MADAHKQIIDKMNREQELMDKHMPDPNPDTARTDALIARHKSESRNISDDGLLRHAVRQAQELIDHAYSLESELSEASCLVFEHTTRIGQLEGTLKFYAMRAASELKESRYSAPFQVADGKVADVQIRFVPREHIHDKPTEANPSPVRVIVMHDLEELANV